jgi:hypothetical protein
VNVDLDPNTALDFKFSNGTDDQIQLNKGLKLAGINAEWTNARVPSFPAQESRIAPDTLVSEVNLRLGVTNLLSVITEYDIEANRSYMAYFSENSSQST